MGFRSLSAFNKALLAKQCWRLLKHPDSLVAQLLKAKYYPLTRVLEVHLGSNPSLTWRSIWNAMDLLKAGLRWRIGDGESVQIFEDRWIPRPHTFKTISTPLSLPENAKVSSLIHPSSSVTPRIW